MNVLMGRATIIQLEELSHCSYQPLAEAFHEILPRETRHAELGEEGLKKLHADGAKSDIAASIDYWRPRVAASFGAAGSSRFEMLKQFGLRQTKNDQLLDAWNGAISTTLEQIDG